ncbi:MAG: TIGR00180 family glycosyltransferase [Deltaproteobacteria bacterium]|nr:TIGR00180 family glycosyltransferase [Deltaproteobacteria bacterium]
MISIIVPTMNRPQFVKRLLDYYAGQSFPHCIYIGDSSEDQKDREQILSAIENLKGQLKAEYVYCPNMNNYEVMQTIIADKVSTPYVSYLADDDFLVPDVIEECLSFMESHPDYFGCCGNAVLFKLNNTGSYGAFDAASFYPAYGIEENGAGERLMTHLSQYTSTFHAVCRKEMMEKALRNTSLIKKEARFGDTDWRASLFFGELLLSCSLVVQGKLKRLDSLHYIRQVHESRYLFPDWFDLISCAAWVEGIQILKKQLAQDLEAKGVPSLLAGSIVKQALWNYIARWGSSKLKQQNNKMGWRENAKKRLKHIPSLKRLWRLFRSCKEECALEAMMRPSSRFHKNFMPVHSLVSNTKEGGL